MGTVVLMIVNLFSSLLHLNTDLSQRGKPLLPLPPILRPSLNLFWGMEGECCWSCIESNDLLLKMF